MSIALKQKASPSLISQNKLIVDLMLLKIVGGEIFPESKDEDDDPLQMGGDFTLSRSKCIFLEIKELLWLEMISFVKTWVL